MPTPPLRAPLLLLPLAAGCTASPDGKGPDGHTDSGVDSVAHTGDSGGPPASPCADGGWGAVTDPASALVVDPGGRAAGAGSVEDPVDSLSTALLRLRERGGGGEVLVASGRYPDTIAELGAEDAAAAAGGAIVVQGCVDRPVLVAGRDDQPVLRVTGVGGVVLHDLVLDGGRGGLWLWGGAEAQGERVLVTGSRDAAIVIDGPDTVVGLDGVDAEDIRASFYTDGEVGLGVLVRNASVQLDHTTVTGATRYGIYVVGDGETHGSLSLSGSTVSGTLPSGEDGLGRAVSAHDAAAVEIDGLGVDGAGDAAVFLQGVRSAWIRELDLGGVAAGTLDGGAPTGDGLVVTGVPPDGSRFDPGLFSARVEGLRGAGLPRAGLLLERVTAEVGEGVEGAAYAQDEASVSGAGAAGVTALAEGEELGLTRSTFDPSELVPDG